jgi:hypothetical protein
MNSDHLKTASMGIWILAVGAVGYVAGATSFAVWGSLVVLSLAPVMVLARLWSAPDPTMSETIREALR